MTLRHRETTLIAGALLLTALLAVVIVTLVTEDFSKHAWGEVGPSLFLVVLVSVVVHGVAATPVMQLLDRLVESGQPITAPDA